VITITLRRSSALAPDVVLFVVVEKRKTRSVLLFVAYAHVVFVVAFTDKEVETKPPRAITILPRRVDPDARRRMR